MRARLASPAVEVGRERQVDEITGRGLAASALLRPRIACAMSAGPDEERCEESPLHTWRFGRFRAMGFDEAVATLLADRDVDWHEAERLVRERGCPVAIAAQILF